MRAKWFAAAVCALLFAAGTAFAGEVGNNPEGTGWRLDFGYERSATEVELDEPAILYFYEETYDYGPDQYGYDIETQWLDSFNGQEILDKYFLKGAYGFGEKYAVYFKLGMARMNAEMYNPVMTWMDEEYDYYYGDEYLDLWYDTELESPSQGVGDWDPFYGVGFKAVFHDAGGFKVGMDVQWNQYKLDANVTQYINNYGYTEGDPETPDYWYEQIDEHRLLETDTTEYQAALVLSKQNEKFSPYGGVKFSQWETEYSGGWYYSYEYSGGSRQQVYEESGDWMFTTQSTDNLGLFLGADYEMTGNFMISGEIQVGDQTATTVKLSWKF